MNTNKILTFGFSNRVTYWEYEKKHAKYGWIEFQCGGCSFFAPFNCDYGLCCYTKSRFFKETVFEHFGCEKYIHEGWGKHSFNETPERE
ncbi:MAG TPA: hypothetical protein DD381_05845 [Lentisphaeria bacterium]|nr:MAG: hypothetical protein A2X47_08265 [Lentisphaerae bacterium GWF2_38_69]HBM15847.1 hypothetical protein [Lentisphaeria bacterium]